MARAAQACVAFADGSRGAAVGSDPACRSPCEGFQGLDLASLLCGRCAERQTAAPIFCEMSGNGAKVGRLTVCPTPIGNLRDITLRTLDVLREVDAIACEDTRRTGLLLEHHGLRRDGVRLISLHEHNERERAAELLRAMRDGAHVALVSDAGMPLISDPGFPLLAAAIAEGIEVEVLPGPSAVLAAVVASGLPVSSFRFVGFLPRSRGELLRLLGAHSETIVAFESPRRVGPTLAVLAGLDPSRPVAVCRELSKLHEQVLRGDATELAAHYAVREARGEIVLVVGGANRQEGDRQAASAALDALVEAGARRRPAARVLASLTGLSANALYRSHPPEPEREQSSGAGSLRRP
jgi:16S rRNA (cytidine1402-2'-O)-methyltransferase